MNSKGLYRNFLAQLQRIYTLNEAGVITDWVFKSIAALTRLDILKNPEQNIAEPVALYIDAALKQLLQHKPVQYILGEAWFYNMKFKVNEHVLIPRPETEELAELIINNEQLIIKPFIQVLDIGTGSGCISIAIKKNLSPAIVSAIDVSENALQLAKENAAYHTADIEFIHLDFLNEKSWQELQVYDIIVSNPPYIPLNEKKKLDKNVTDYEPSIALFVPANSPLLFYEKIAAFAKEHLNKNGKIYLETHEDYSNKVVELFSNYKNAVIKKDIFGKERMVVVSG